MHTCVNVCVILLPFSPVSSTKLGSALSRDLCSISFLQVSQEQGAKMWKENQSSSWERNCNTNWENPTMGCEAEGVACTGSMALELNCLFPSACKNQASYIHNTETSLLLFKVRIKYLQIFSVLVSLLLTTGRSATPDGQVIIWI